MILNVNVGLLGHVDSGKTSLCKALSTVASTAAFDKNPQSQKRGITLDLGFSSFTVKTNIPPQLSSPESPVDALQITLVDCPGHASLIRTIICGSHIIDMMLLVVDVNKGFQTQTAECLIIGELTCEVLLVVLNKVDLLEPSTREEKIAKMKSRIIKTLAKTRFSGAPIVAVSAIATQQAADGPHSTDMANLIQLLLASIPNPRAKREQQLALPFLFAVDHCFVKTGQGTVLTGTVLRGSVHVGETVEIPQHKLQKKVKSIQMFRNPVEVIGPGDRAGICIAQLDAGVMERGFVVQPGSLLPCSACLLSGVTKIGYFKSTVRSKGKFHVSVGQDTVLARITCLLACTPTSTDSEPREFQYLDMLPDVIQDASIGGPNNTFMLLQFDTPVVVPVGELAIGSRLDADPLAPSCRLAFHGKVVNIFPTADLVSSLPVYRLKSRAGEVERLADSRSCIVRDLFKRETNFDIFQGLKVHVRSTTTDAGDAPIEALDIPGVIEGSFGLSGKCRVRLSEDLPDSLVQKFGSKGSKKVGSAASSTDPRTLSVVLEFKKHVFDPKRRFVQ
uniref:Selenocysteine-specific elongation factor n=4 Tax=Schistocephalus solidus TaxID=70667 RepID=A0A0X3NK56_SCHSO